MDKYKWGLNIAELCMLCVCMLITVMCFWVGSPGGFIEGLVFLICGALVGTDLVFRASTGEGFFW